MKKIFVSKQGGIGDVLISTPVLAEIKKYYPDSKLMLMIFPNAVDMVQGISFIDEIIAYDKKNMSFYSLWRKLLGYDVAILLDLSYRPAMAAALLVNSCSMPIHAASAVDTPCVVLYGFGDYKRWAPKCNCEVVVTPLSCSPCDGYHGTKCTDPKCMRSISVETVFQAVERCLSK